MVPVDIRKLHNDNEQLESEMTGLRAQLQQLQTLSENQKSEIQSLQLLVNGKISRTYCMSFFLFEDTFATWQRRPRINGRQRTYRNGTKEKYMNNKFRLSDLMGQ